MNVHLLERAGEKNTYYYLENKFAFIDKQNNYFLMLSTQFKPPVPVLHF